MGLKAVVHFIEEMLSKKSGKATHKFMSCIGGVYSWKNMTLEQKDAGVGQSGVNDTAESHFAYTKYEKQKFGTNLSVLSAGGVAVAKSTGFMR